MFGGENIDQKPVTEKLDHAMPMETIIVGDARSPCMYNGGQYSRNILNTRRQTSKFIALVFANDRSKDHGIGSIRFHAAISEGVSVIGPKYKASSVRVVGSETWLTARREGQNDAFDGHQLLNHINNQVRIRFSLKQKRLVTESATVSTPQTSSALESAISITQGGRAYKKKAESFLNLFRDYGFEDSEIQKLSEYPRLGRASVENLKPKLDFFVEIGFTGKLLHNLIVSSPYVLLLSLDCRIKPNLQVLNKYLGSDEKVLRLLNRNKRILTINLERYLIPNIELLINEGVPVDRVSKLLLSTPRVFMRWGDSMAYAVKTVKNFGVAPDKTVFIRCIRVVCGFSESKLKKKLEFFKSLGWSDEQLSNVCKTYPDCLCLSEENIRSKMRFYVNTLKVEPETVFSNPILLGRSADIVYARYEVLKILKSQKLIRGVSVASAAKMSEDRFLNSYVIKHEDSVPGLLVMYYDIADGRKNKTGT